MDLPCQILVETSCCKINFRIYIGHIGTKAVDVAVKHLTEAQSKKGLGCLSNCYWLKMSVVDVTSNTRHQVLINKGSLLKRLKAAGVARGIIKACIASKDFSLLNLAVTPSRVPKNISSSIFYSHGPLL